MLKYLFIILLFSSPLAFGQLTNIPVENEHNYQYLDVFFLNEEIGFIVGYEFGFPSKGVVLRTTDGGGLWTKLFESNNELAFFSVFFVDENIGYVGVQDGAIYKTTDGGDNFIKLNTSNIPFTFDYVDMYFISENEGLLLGASDIYKTSDGAASLYKVYEDNRTWEKVQFINQDVAYALGFGTFSSIFDAYPYDNVFVKTTDQGESWEIIVDSLDYNLKSFHFLNETTVFACSYRGEIYKSTDAGQSWEIVATSSEECSPALFDITFFNEQVGYAVGGIRNCPSLSNAVLWETRDGGQNWQRILELEGEEYFRKIVRVSDNSGLIISKRGKIFKILSDDLTEIKELELGNDFDVQSSPNPFQENFSLQFDLQKPSIVNIELYTITGQKQTILTAKRLETGLQSIEIKPSFSSTSNIYFIEVSIDGQKHIEKVLQYK